MGDTKRLVFSDVLPAGQRAMIGLERVVHESTLEVALLELVKIRASQINGCAFCLDTSPRPDRPSRTPSDRPPRLADRAPGRP